MGDEHHSQAPWLLRLPWRLWLRLSWLFLSRMSLVFGSIMALCDVARSMMNGSSPQQQINLGRRADGRFWHAQEAWPLHLW